MEKNKIMLLVLGEEGSKGKGTGDGMIGVVISNGLRERVQRESEMGGNATRIHRRRPS